MTTADSSSTDRSFLADSLTPSLTTRSAEQLAKLWEEAISDYKSTARLSAAELTILQRGNSPDEVFDLTKSGWEENVIQKRWRHHESVGRTFSQVLGVFDAVNAVLGLAAKVGHSPYPSESTLIGPRRPFPRFRYFPGLSNFCCRYVPAKLNGDI